MMPAAKSNHSSSQQGAILIVLIVVILILAVVASFLYSLTATSTLNQAEAQKGINAFYAAESGTRLVASEYRQTAADKNGALANLDGKTFQMPNNRGQFTVNVYPYWFYIPTTSSGYAANATSITLRIPGSTPLLNNDGSTTTITLPATGRLKVKGKGQVARYSSRTISGQDVTYSLSRPFSFALVAGDEIFLSFLPSTSQTVDKKGTLVLQADARIFPPENGSIAIALPNVGIYDFRYDKRIPALVDPANPPATVTLTNIDDLNTSRPAQFPLTIINCNPSDNTATCHDDFTADPATCTTIIYLGKSLGIKSEGIFGP